MKSLSLILLLSLFSVNVFTQITIDQNDMPSDGDTIRTSTSVNLGAINYQETGTGFTWDFSSLIPLSQTVDTFVSVQETPWLYQIIFFSSSNLAKKLQEFEQFPGFELTDTYEYYKKSNSDFRMTGNAATLAGIPIPNKFQNPDVIYKFPVNYGNEDSSLSNYEISVPGIGYAGGWKKRVNHADGWGTLTTPYGTFQTIRIKSDILQFDSVYLDTLGMGIPVYRQFTEYKWLGEGFGLPLCMVTDDGLLPTISYIDSVRTLFVGITEPILNQSNIDVYPNPSFGSVEVTFSQIPDQEVLIRIYDLNGSLARTESYSNVQKFHLNLEDFKPGTYILTIETGKEIYHQRIILME
jgi:hypothetical protein